MVRLLLPLGKVHPASAAKGEVEFAGFTRLAGHLSGRYLYHGIFILNT